MTKILFVCHGNICRSPMAEFFYKDLVLKEGIADQFHIESAATTSEDSIIWSAWMARTCATCAVLPVVTRKGKSMG